MAAVHSHISAQVPCESHSVISRGCRQHERAAKFCQLNSQRANRTACPVDDQPLAGSHPKHAIDALESRETASRERPGAVEGDSLRHARDAGRWNGGIFRIETPSGIVPAMAVDGITDFECRHHRPDRGHEPSPVSSHHQRKGRPGNVLESLAHVGVPNRDASSAHSDQNILCADPRKREGMDRQNLRSTRVNDRGRPHRLR